MKLLRLLRLSTSITDDTIMQIVLWNKWQLIITRVSIPQLTDWLTDWLPAILYNSIVYNCLLLAKPIGALSLYIRHDSVLLLWWGSIMRFFVSLPPTFWVVRYQMQQRVGSTGMNDATKYMCRNRYRYMTKKIKVAREKGQLPITN